MITRQLQVERGTGKFAMCHAINLLTLTPWDRLSVVFLTEDHGQVAHSPDGRTDGRTSFLSAQESDVRLRGGQLHLLYMYSRTLAAAFLFLPDKPSLCLKDFENIH